ncbi:class I SAM-dependent methyltransferase [Paenibacillus allorhizosphaerae]|uniref:class I SAM-dependent methyltransferase n=2 Tax=Paenibacillus allorhizosphaerae TaxID=2849866 RepID=UPI00361C6951
MNISTESRMNTKRFEYLFNRLDSRWNSPYAIKRYIHRIKIEKICSQLEPGESLLDAGRGGSVDGVLGVFAAKKGLQVTISNVSEDNLDVIKYFAELQGVREKIIFVKSNPDNLVFDSETFDIVASLHVLEHLADFNKGLNEIYRVTKKKAIIALPTCINPCAFSRLGGADYFRFTLLSPIAFIYGFIRIIYHILKGDDGVEETMEELGQTIKHKWRFPWKMRSSLRGAGFVIDKFEPDSVCIPWFPFMLSIMKFLDRYSHLPLIRECGLGSHVFVSKK